MSDTFSCSNEQNDSLPEPLSENVRNEILNVYKGLRSSEKYLGREAEKVREKITGMVEGLKEEIIFELFDSEDLDLVAIVASGMKENRLQRIVFENLKSSSGKKAERVLAALAENENLHETLMQDLARFSNENVKVHLASNSSLSDTVAEFLMKDSSVYVRRAVAANKNVANPIKKKLLYDSDEVVRILAEEFFVSEDESSIGGDFRFSLESA